MAVAGAMGATAGGVVAPAADAAGAAAGRAAPEDAGRVGQDHLAVRVAGVVRVAEDVVLVPAAAEVGADAVPQACKAP
jgi:hypothetical protein